MSASEARLAANRANALKSTGPKTDEGKERSRGNAVKHGLTGAGVALAAEMAEAVEARARGFQDSYRPATEAGQELVRRAALLSVRLERCAAREAEAIASNVRAAEADFDEARETEVDALFAMLAENPAIAVRRLMRMPEGVDRMIGAWRDLRHVLRVDLTPGQGSRWKDAHKDLSIHLTGRKPDGTGCSRVEALLGARNHFFVLLGPEDGAGLEGKARREWAMRELEALMEAEIRRLEAHRATLDLDRIAADRAGASALALFDPSKEATLARGYEAAAERGMHRALKEMRAVEAEAKARPQAQAGATRAVSPSPLGSFSPPPTPRDPEPTPEPEPAPSPARFEAERAADRARMDLDRPRLARS